MRCEPAPSLGGGGLDSSARGLRWRGVGDAGVDAHGRLADGRTHAATSSGGGDATTAAADAGTTAADAATAATATATASPSTSATGTTAHRQPDSAERRRRPRRRQLRRPQ
jgi:hypothetical protein